MSFNLFAGPIPADVPRFFACLLPTSCRGLVVGNEKIVYFPDSRQTQRYDLAKDPEESEPLELLPEHFVLRQKIQIAAAAHRTLGLSLPLRAIHPYGRWHCPPDAPCTHRDFETRK